MTTITMRKPSFMRNDTKMRVHLKVIDTLTKELNDPKLTHEERYNLLASLRLAYDDAAKAGGFLGKSVFLKWLDSQNNT